MILDALPVTLLSNIALVIVAIVNFLLGAIVFLNRDHATRMGAIFSVLAFTVSIWTFAIAFYRQTEIYSQALLALKILYIVPVFIPIFFVGFVYLYSRRPPSVLRYPGAQFALLLAGAVVSLAVYATKAFLVDVRIPPVGEKIIIFGDWYWLYVLYFMVTFSWGYFLLLRQYFSKNDRELKIQVLYLFAGTFIASAISMTTNLILPWMGVFDYNWFGNITTIFFVGFIFYAVVRHKLFDIKIVSTELLTFGIWLLFLFELLLSESVLEQLANGASLAVSIFLGVFIIQSVKKEVSTRENLQKTLVKLEEANQRLMMLDEQKTEFVSVASHQLRAPVAAIRGYTSLVLEGSFGKILPSVREALEKVENSGKAMADMIEDFLNISRIERGSMQYSMTDFDFSKIVIRVAENMRPSAVRKNLEFSVSIAPSKEGYMVHGDSGKLQQVVSNLVDNAIKYTAEGSVTLDLAHRADERRIHLTIQDSGIGITKEDQWQLFSKFQRGDNANTANVHGTGLGLYVAKEMVQQHNGLIWVESDGASQGTTFHVELNSLN